MRKKADGNSIPNAFLNIVGQNTLQNELLLSFLKKEAGLEGKCFPTLESIPPFDENDSEVAQLLLLDFNSMDMEKFWDDIRVWNCSQYYPCYFVLYNAEPALEIEKDAMDNGIHGIFYNNEPLHSILKGICTILNGELWYSRETLKKILAGKRFSSNSSAHPAPSRLTAREKEILAFIASGYTSKAMADHFRISVHTVKTHVYNIYKEIKVTNRLQASLWAIKYL